MASRPIASVDPSGRAYHLETLGASRPEIGLENRHRLAYDWLPESYDAILDAGCSWGYATRQYATRATYAAGIDPDEDAIAVATARYPGIDFRQGVLEELPFASERFDVVVCSDTLEHVQDEVRSLNELWRVLKPGGTLILSTPHRGLFAWLDHSNYLPALRLRAATHAPRLFRRIQGWRGREALTPEDDQYDVHRHYDLADYRRLFAASDMGDGYLLERSFRSGLVLFPLALNVTFYSTALPIAARARVREPFRRLAEWEYWRSFGPLAYNVAVRVRKREQPDGGR